MSRAASWIAELGGWRRAGFGILIGALSVLAFAPVHAWPVLFFTFGALVWLLDGCHGQHESLRDRLKCAGMTGFWFGFGYFLAGLYWIAEAFLVEPWRHGWLLPFVMTALPGGMALFWSEDDGIHWRPAGIADGDVGFVRALVPAADRRDAAWAGTDSGALLRSDDRGRGWRVVAREPAAILCLASAR